MGIQYETKKPWPHLGEGSEIAFLGQIMLLNAPTYIMAKSFPYGDT
jgi:hypothetical protein